MSKPCILIVEDREDIRLSARFLLEGEGYNVCDSNSPQNAQELLNKRVIDLILLDMNYSLDTTSGEEGLAFLSWLSKAPYKIPVVVMTACANVELAVKSMQNGAGDFIEKPWKNQRLLLVLQQQLALARLQIQNQKLQQRLTINDQPEYIWRSACMQKLINQLNNVAKTEASIFLSGEHGTGKSQLARYIHSVSQRNQGPFISVNMGGISETLFESEIFGHKKGAFTDAKADRIGRFCLAENGTLFLDEIANIPLSQQVKLLRVLESNEYEILGSSQTVKANARIISATNGDIEKLIEQEKFREDLFYRLNILKFELPALRERSEDIIPLAHHFLNIYCAKYQLAKLNLDSEVVKAMEQYHWPGNIRELDHLMQRAVLLAHNGTITLDELNISLSQNTNELPQMTLEKMEIKMIKEALKNTDNNIQKAATLLGLTKSSLYRRLEKHEELRDYKP